MSTLLRMGSRGPEVTRLQKLLNTLVDPRPPLKADGIFGTRTRDAVIAFQVDKRLDPDGIVGPKTSSALEQSAAINGVDGSRDTTPPPDPTTKPVASDEDYGDITTFGKEPSANGEVNTYDVWPYGIFFLPTMHPTLSGKLTAPPLRKRATRDPRAGSYKVVYVNGQLGNPKKHMMQSCAVAAVTGGEVDGVHNSSTKSVILDTIKSMWSKATSSLGMNVTAKVAKFLGDQNTAEQEVRQYLSDADLRPTVALFDLLLRPEYSDARIVGHSQGNIIICNALNGVIACRGAKAVEGMKVFAIASPTVFWEKEVDVTVYNFSNDAVGWLSGHSGTLDACAKRWSIAEDKGIDGSPGSEIVLSYKANGDWLTHSFYIYLGELWDKLRVEFP